MASTITAELMRRQEERAKIVDEALYRQKDKAVRKCPKCGNVNFAKVNIDDDGDVTTDCNIVYYCTNCLAIIDTEEVKIE